MKGLTKRQREVIDFIQTFINTNRYSPSFREISSHFGFQSIASVAKHVDALKRKGALTFEEKASRSLALIDTPKEQVAPQGTLIPFIGMISAGVPIKTFSQAQEISIPASFTHVPEKTYALRVEGESLREEMIADGDLLIVEARHQAYAGETVVALVNSHDTIVKKYYPEGDRVRLLGSCAQHHPIILSNQVIQIQGVLIGLLRHYG